MFAGRDAPATAGETPTPRVPEGVLGSHICRQQQTWGTEELSLRGAANGALLSVNAFDDPVEGVLAKMANCRSVVGWRTIW